MYGPIAHGLLAGTFTPQTIFAADDWRSKSDIHLTQATLREIEHIMREAVSIGGPAPEGM